MRDYGCLYRDASGSERNLPPPGGISTVAMQPYLRLPALLLVVALGLPSLAGGQKLASKGGGDQQPSTSAAAGKQPPAKQKLVLKDGTDQLVRSYQRQGDRVRYFSLERNEWEEVPASLVDWTATEEANRKEQEEALRKAQQAGERDQQALAGKLGTEIAPGLWLPEEEGLFVVENGKVLALPKQQASARVDKGRLLTNVVLPVPLLKNRNLVEVPGARATLRLENPPPALFANGRTRDDSRYALVRLKPKGNVRRVEAILVNIFSRKGTHSGDYIELSTETVAPNVVRLVPSQPLSPGEYAVVEFLGNDLNLFLWDFGVGK